MKLKKSAPARRALSDALFKVRDTILILDEVQGIQQGVPHFLKAPGSVFNENHSLQIIFTGSYSGVVRRLFEATYSDESYGKPPISIMLAPWKESVVEDFLRTGFEKLGVPYEKWEIRDAIRNLGTLPGWLNLYGVKRYVERNHERALKMAVREAVKEAKFELENILRGRSPKAREVVRLLAFGASWGDLIKTGISEDALSRLLGILKDELFILNKDEMGVYYFADPVYRKAAMNISLVAGE